MKHTEIETLLLTHLFMKFAENNELFAIVIKVLNKKLLDRIPSIYEDFLE